MPDTNLVAGINGSCQGFDSSKVNTAGFRNFFGFDSQSGQVHFIADMGNNYGWQNDESES